MSGPYSTPSKVEQEVPFQPVVHARDGTPRRTLQQSEYERRKDVCTSHFLQKLHSDMRQRDSKAPTTSQPGSSQDFATKLPKYLGLAFATILIPLLGVIISQYSGRINIPGTSSISWAAIFPGERQADWSFGCQLKNITKDRDAGSVSFTVYFADLPTTAFASESFQAVLGGVYKTQITELGDYAFNATGVLLEFSDSSASIDTNVTFGTSSELIVFVGKLTTGTLAGRLHYNRAFRRVMADAGYAPAFKTAPAAIKGSWLEPMVESAAKTQEEAAEGLLGYMYKVQQSYDEVRRLLLSSEGRQANLSQEVQSKSAALNQAQLKLTKLQKDLESAVGQLESVSKGREDLKKWQAGAKDKIATLSSDVSRLQKDVTKKERLLEDLTTQHQSLQVMHKDTLEKLKTYQSNKSQLIEERGSLQSANAALQKTAAAASSKLNKILAERFNVTAAEGASLSSLINIINKQLMLWTTTSKQESQKIEADLASVKAEFEKAIAEHQSALSKAESKYNTTLQQKDKEAAAALALAQGSTKKEVEAATRSLKDDITKLEKQAKEYEKTQAMLQSRLDTAQSQLKDKDAKIEELQKKERTLTDEIVVLNKQLKGAVRTRETLQNKVTNLEGELGSCHSQSRQTSTSIKLQEQRISKLESMVAKLLRFGSVFDDVGKEFAEFKKLSLEVAESVETVVKVETTTVTETVTEKTEAPAS